MPAVIRTPGVRPGTKTVFKAFKKEHTKKRKHQPSVIEGENKANADIKYKGTQDNSQKYCLITKDLKTGRLDLLDASLFEVSSYSSKQNPPELAQTIRQAGVQNWQQRTNLGEAFGTKKAKTAISDVARNRLEADMLEGLEDAIIDNVQTRTANMPSQEQRQETAESIRPIPEHDSETTNVSEIYKLESVVSFTELDLLDGIVDELISQGAVASLDNLPSQSDFVNARIVQVLSEDSNIKPRLQILVYTSFLLAVYNNRRVNNRKTLMEKIPNLPYKLFDGILERFTVAKPGRVGLTRDMNFSIDPFHLNKLLCYLLVLMLHANNFSIDVTPLAHELSLTVVKLGNLCRNLGCVVRPASKAEAGVRELHGMSASSYRIAELKAPLRLPDVVRRKRN